MHSVAESEGSDVGRDRMHGSGWSSVRVSQDSSHAGWAGRPPQDGVTQGAGVEPVGGYARGSAAQVSPAGTTAHSPGGSGGGGDSGSVQVEQAGYSRKEEVEAAREEARMQAATAEAWRQQVWETLAASGR